MLWHCWFLGLWWTLTRFTTYRGYPESKVDENMDAEIFGLLLEEAEEAYDEEIVIELTSENSDEIESNCARISAWVQAWKKSHSEEARDAWRIRRFCSCIFTGYKRRRLAVCLNAVDPGNSRLFTSSKPPHSQLTMLSISWGLCSGGRFCSEGWCQRGHSGLEVVAGLTHLFLFVHLCIGFTLVLEDRVPAYIVRISQSIMQDKLACKSHGSRRFSMDTDWTYQSLAVLEQKRFCPTPAFLSFSNPRRFGGSATREIDVPKSSPGRSRVPHQVHSRKQMYILPLRNDHQKNRAFCWDLHVLELPGMIYCVFKLGYLHFLAL